MAHYYKIDDGVPMPKDCRKPCLTTDDLKAVLTNLLRGSDIQPRIKGKDKDSLQFSLYGDSYGYATLTNEEAEKVGLLLVEAATFNRACVASA